MKEMFFLCQNILFVSMSYACFFYKKLVSTQLLNKLWKFSTGFLRLKKFLLFIYLEFNNFCYLVRFITILSVHGALSLSIDVHVQNIGTQKSFAKKVLRKF